MSTPQVTTIDWLKAGRAVAIERTVSGSLNVIPIARDGRDLWTQRCALENVSPFKQDLTELRWQFYKAGHLTITEATA